MIGVLILSFVAGTSAAVQTKPPLQANYSGLIKLYVGQYRNLLKLDQYGTVIDHEVLYPSGFRGEYPCLPERQQVVFDDPVYAENLISSFTADDFRYHFIDGHFNTNIPHIVGFEQVGEGAVVLTSDAKLYLLDIQRSVSGQITIFPNEIRLRNYHIDSKDAILIYEHSTHQLIVLSSSTHLVISIVETQVADISSLDTDIRVSDIKAIARIGDYICMASKVDGLVCYQLVNERGFQLKQIFKDDTISPVDLRVTGRNMAYKLYVLDELTGIHIYNVIIGFNKPMLLKVNKTPIGAADGVAFDIHGNTIMLIRHVNQYYFLHDYHIDLKDHSWSQLNEWVFQSKIYDVDVNDDFAIVTGTNGHHIVYHSVYKSYYTDVFKFTIDSRSKSDLYMPNLKRIDFFAKDLNQQGLSNNETQARYHNVVLGATKHRFFVMNFNLKPITLSCYSESTDLVSQSPINIEYLLNSTQCPAKKDREDDMQICQTRFSFEIIFKKSLLNKSWLFLVLAIMGIVFGSIILTCLCVVIRYVSFHGISRQIEKDLQTYAEQGFKLDESDKLKGVSVAGDKPEFGKYAEAPQTSNPKTPFPENSIE